MKPKTQETSYPDLMIESELIEFLRIPDIAKTENYHYVIENLKRMHGLPCIHIARQPLYPQAAINQWILDKIEQEQRR